METPQSRDWIFITLFIALFIFIYLILEKVKKMNEKICVLQGRTENIPFQPTQIFTQAKPVTAYETYFEKKENEIFVVDPKGNAKKTTKNEAKEAQNHE